MGGRLTVDNGGNCLTGTWRGRVAAYYNNLFGSRAGGPHGLGDRLTATALMASGAQAGSLMDGNVSYKIPVGWWPLNVGASVGTVRYALGEEMAPLDASGKTMNASLTLGYPLRRTAGWARALTRLHSEHYDVSVPYRSQ